MNGKSDIYGLGVRLGIYLQWATSILAENVDPAEVTGTRASGLYYQIAMFSGLIRVSQYPGDEVLALEGYIVLLFCFAGVWASSFALQGLRWSDRDTMESAPPPDVEATRFGTFVSVLLSTAIIAYGTWFLFTGMANMKRRDEACEELVFFFARAALFGWALIVDRVFFVVRLTASAVLLAYRTYTFVENFDLLLGDWKKAPDLHQSSGQPRQVQDAQLRQPHVKVQARKLIGSVATMSVFVVAIELTLRWNHIMDVYECNNFSQVFPLAIGASGFVTTVFNVGKKVSKKDLKLSLTW